MALFRKRKIGIALSGGAARGLAHIGVLQVLDEIGVEISAVSGCSMGAVIGAVYSLGYDLQEIEEYIKNTDWRNFLLFSVLALSRAGIVNDYKVEEVFKKYFGDKNFDECSRQFCCVAVDIISGKKVVLKTGKIKDAVRASISVPGIFPPVYTDNGILVDGGLMEPLPTDAIGELDCNYIIASSISFDRDIPVTQATKAGVHQNDNHDIKKMSIQSILDKSMNLVHTQLVQSYIEKADIVIEPKIGDFGFFDFVKGLQIIEAGRKAAIKKIPEIKKKLKIR
ncbi:MAG: patatin-like phospholipase family protein [Actinobacteria bacterium]|nr:patatin-like phospholipase family protein [Actinomycetota bacterium]